VKKTNPCLDLGPREKGSGSRYHGPVNETISAHCSQIWNQCAVVANVIAVCKSDVRCSRLLNNITCREDVQK